MFSLRKKPDKNLKVTIASIDELKQSGFKDWFEVKTRRILGVKEMFFIWMT
jgi:hypothetical protein